MPSLLFEIDLVDRASFFVLQLKIEDILRLQLYMYYNKGTNVNKTLFYFMKDVDIFN